MLGLFRRKADERAGFELYGAAVRGGRDPYLYETLGVPDTLDGRFDLVGLHAVLLIRRLSAAGPAGGRLAQALFDAMFSDMDFNLREMGVSELSVGKRNREMWEALHGRAQAYDAPLERRDVSALAAALERNIWRGEATPPGATQALAALILRRDHELEGQRLLDGQATFAPVVAKGAAVAGPAPA